LIVLRIYGIPSLFSRSDVNLLSHITIIQTQRFIIRSTQKSSTMQLQNFLILSLTTLALEAPQLLPNPKAQKTITGALGSVKTAVDDLDIAVKAINSTDPTALIPSPPKAPPSATSSGAPQPPFRAPTPSTSSARSPSRNLPRDSRTR